MLSVSYSDMITPSDVPYSNSGRDALCLVPDAHRCSAVDVTSCALYFPSGRSGLFVVRDAHRYSDVVVESYTPYFPSGHNALCVVRDAHRCCTVVVVTQLTSVPKQTFAADADCCSKLRGRFHEDSRSVCRAQIEAYNLS